MRTANDFQAHNSWVLRGVLVPGGRFDVPAHKAQ